MAGCLGKLLSRSLLLTAFSTVIAVAAMAQPNPIPLPPDCRALLMANYESFRSDERAQVAALLVIDQLRLRNDNQAASFFGADQYRSMQGSWKRFISELDSRYVSSSYRMEEQRRVDYLRTFASSDAGEQFLECERIRANLPESRLRIIRLRGSPGARLWSVRFELTLAPGDNAPRQIMFESSNVDNINSIRSMIGDEIRGTLRRDIPIAISDPNEEAFITVFVPTLNDQRTFYFPPRSVLPQRRAIPVVLTGTHRVRFDTNTTGYGEQFGQFCIGYDGTSSVSPAIPALGDGEEILGVRIARPGVISLVDVPGVDIRGSLNVQTLGSVSINSTDVTGMQEKFERACVEILVSSRQGNASICCAIGGRVSAFLIVGRM